MLFRITVFTDPFFTRSIPKEHHLFQMTNITFCRVFWCGSRAGRAVRLRRLLHALLEAERRVAAAVGLEVLGPRCRARGSRGHIFRRGWEYG